MYIYRRIYIKCPFMSIYVHLFFKDDDCSGQDCTFVHLLYIEELKKKEEPPRAGIFAQNFGKFLLKLYRYFDKIDLKCSYERF